MIYGLHFCVFLNCGISALFGAERILTKNDIATCASARVAFWIDSVLFMPFSLTFNVQLLKFGLGTAPIDFDISSFFIVVVPSLLTSPWKERHRWFINVERLAFWDFESSLEIYINVLLWSYLRGCEHVLPCVWKALRHGSRCKHESEVPVYKMCAWRLRHFRQSVSVRKRYETGRDFMVWNERNYSTYFCSVCLNPRPNKFFTVTSEIYYATTVKVRQNCFVVTLNVFI